jgi:hypothetical protein
VLRRGGGRRTGRVLTASPGQKLQIGDAFTHAYLEAAEFFDCHADFPELHASKGFSNAFVVRSIADCRRLQDTQVAELGTAYTTGYTPRQAGIDYWLTRNGHGAGFWDRDLGDVGDRLTAAAEADGMVDLYVGDDGRIYAQ